MVETKTFSSVDEAFDYYIPGWAEEKKLKAMTLPERMHYKSNKRCNEILDEFRKNISLD